MRRSGGQLQIDHDPARPGAALVARLVKRARARAQDEKTPESALLGAIEMLSAIDPDGSRGVLLERLAPREPRAVQIAVVRALAEARNAEAAEILLPRLRAFEPAVRAAAIRAVLGRADGAKALACDPCRRSASRGRDQLGID